MGVTGGNSGGGGKRRCRQSNSACGDADKGGADRLGTAGGCGQLAGGQLDMPGLTNFVGRSTGDGGCNGGSVRRCERAKEERAMCGRRGTNRNEVVTGDKETGNPQAQECARAGWTAESAVKFHYFVIVEQCESTVDSETLECVNVRSNK